MRDVRQEAQEPQAALTELTGLPAPTGPHRVGRVSADWVDAGRAEVYSSDPRDRRELVVWIWYPAAPGPDAGRADGWGGWGIPSAATPRCSGAATTGGAEPQPTWTGRCGLRSGGPGWTARRCSCWPSTPSSPCPAPPRSPPGWPPTPLPTTPRRRSPSTAGERCISTPAPATPCRSRELPT